MERVGLLFKSCFGSCDPTPMANGIYEPEFGRLHYAILHEPHKVEAIVLDNRSILESTNATGENVLRWCALENRFDDVELLRSLGSSIQSVTLCEAIDMGHSDMLLLLLELGGEITESEVARSFNIGKRYLDLDAQTFRTMQGHLGAYGVHVDLSALHREHFPPRDW